MLSRLGVVTALAVMSVVSGCSELGTRPGASGKLHGHMTLAFTPQDASSPITTTATPFVGRTDKGAIWLTNGDFNASLKQLPARVQTPRYGHGRLALLQGIAGKLASSSALTAATTFNGASRDLVSTGNFVDSSGYAAAVFITDAQAASYPAQLEYTETVVLDGVDHQATVRVVQARLGDPSTNAALYIDGSMVASQSTNFTKVDGGWYASTTTGTVVDQAGQVVGSGGVGFHDYNTEIINDSYGALPAKLLQPLTNGCTVVYNALTPTNAYAGPGCGYFSRAMVISMIGMAASGAMGNPIGFFIGALSFVNSMHGYASCMEGQK